MLFDYVLFTLTGTMMTCFVTLMCMEKERFKKEKLEQKKNDEQKES